MKRYSQLVRELPSRTVVLAIEDFSAPTAKDELRFKMIDKLVESNNADHFVYVSESKDSLPIDRKIHFLNLMFGEYNYRELNESAEQLIARLESIYKKVIVISNNLKAPLAESTQLLPLEETTTNVKSLVSKGNYTEFKKLMPSTMRDIDCRLMMNEMRKVQGLEPLKEEVKFTIDQLRDKYFKGEIYHIGDIVESAGENYEIMDRGSNYLVVVDGQGNLHRKWVKDVNLVESVKKPTGDLKKACWKGYTAVGLKKKNGRMVPNCVPEEVEVNEEKGNYTVTVHHVHPDGRKEQFHYKVGSANDETHAKRIALQKHGQKKLPTKMYGASTDDVKKLDEECGCEVSYKGYTTKNMKHAPELAKTLQLTAVDASDPIAMLHAIKTTDTYLDIHNERGENPSLDQIKTWKHSHIKAKESLMKLGVFDAHQDQWIKTGEELDKMLVPHAKALKESAFDNYHIASDVMRYTDFMKLMKLSKGQVPPGTISRTTNAQTAINVSHEKPMDYPHTKEGHTLDADDHIRRMKVKYYKEDVDKKDTITFDIPMLIRLLELVRENVKSDASLHKVVEKLIAIRHKGVLTMDEYKFIEGLREQYMPEAAIVNVKPLPPELAPQKDPKDVERTRDRSFSAFYEKNKKMAKKENLDVTFADLMNYRIQKESGDK